MDISVIIPAYNRAKTIERAIMSVLNQTVLPMEIIVVDDCSADSTVEKVKEIRKKNERIRLLRLKENRGAQAARNCGITASKGEWIVLLDSDDELLEYTIETYLESAKKNPGYDIYYGDYYDNKDGKIHYKNCRMDGKNGNFFSSILYSSKVLFQSMMVKKQALENIGLLDENVPAYQEWDTNIRLALNHRYYYIHKPLFVYYSLYDGETISRDLKRSVQGFRYVVMSNWDLFKKDGMRGVIFYLQGMLSRCERCEKYKKCYYMILYKVASLLTFSRFGSNVCIKVAGKHCIKKHTVIGVKNEFDRNKKKGQAISCHYKK